MPQIIEVPGGEQVEFPDGMSDADIVSAIKRTQAKWGPANGLSPKRPNPAPLNTAGGTAGVAASRTGPLLPSLGDIKNALPDSESFHEVDEDISDNKGIPSTHFEVKPDDGVITAVSKTAANMLTGIPKFIASPKGVVTVATGTIFPRIVAGLFAADASKNVVQKANEVTDHWDKLTPGQKSAAVTDVTGNTLMALMMGKGATEGLVKPSEPLPPGMAPNAVGKATAPARPGFGIPIGETPQGAKLDALIKNGAIPPQAPTAGGIGMSPKLENELNSSLKDAKPVVPETPPEAEKGINVLVEIRAHGARSIADIQRLYPQAQLTRESARQLRDQAWGKQPQAVQPSQTPPAPPASPAPPGPPGPTSQPTAKTDYEIYTDAQAIMKASLEKGDTTSPEFQNAWKTAEQAKNRHGGFPPPKPSEPSPNLQKSEPPTAPATAPKVGTASLSPNDIEPAIRVGQKVVTGGSTHAEIASNSGDPDVIEAASDDKNHIFVTKDGKKLSRIQAAKAIGETTPLQSERLNELKNKAAGVNQQPPRSPVAPVSGESKMGESVQTKSPITDSPTPKNAENQLNPQLEPTPRTPTGIKNETVDRERAVRGLPPAVEPARRSFGKVWDQAMAIVDREPDRQTDLINELRGKPRAITDTEDALLLQRQIDLQNEHAKLSKQIADANEDPNLVSEIKPRLAKVSDDLLDLYNINKRVGTETGRGLNARKMMAYEDYSLAAMESKLRAARDGKPLNAEQASKIKELAARVDELQKKIDTYQKQVSGDSKEPLFSDYILKTAEKIVGSLDKAADAARERIKERSKRLNIGLDPTVLVDYAAIGASHIVHLGLDFAKWSDAMVKELGESVTPHLKQIYESSQRTIDRIAEETAPNNQEAKRAVKKQPSGNPRLKALKTRYLNRTEELKSRMLGNDFTPKEKKPLQLDQEAMNLKAAYERSKLEFDRLVMKERLKNRSMLEKTQDTFTKWRRGFLLSSPITLAKLTSAAIQRLAITPIEEATGAVYSRLPFLSRIAQMSPREGGMNVNAEAKALTEGLTKGMRDSWQTLKTGHSDMDSLFGKNHVAPREMIDFIGSVHGALKAPVKRAEFARSFEKRAAWAIRQGQDVSDPMIQTKLCIEAYKDAQRAIFMQDNKVSAAWNAALKILDSPDKTGKVPVGRKAIATALKSVLPIVKVPTNIVAETLQYVFGSVTGSARLGLALRNGVEKLKPEDADLIMRDLKKGSLGSALLLLGYLSPSLIGGYYQMNDKKSIGHPKFGSIQVGGVNVPTFLIHNPLLETLQIGATVRHVADSKLRKKDYETQGLGSGIFAGLIGITDEVPFVREPMELLKVMNPYERNHFADQFARDMIVPLGVSWVAKHFDRDSQGNYIARDESTLANTIKGAIPILRKNVPVDRKRTVLQ